MKDSKTGVPLGGGQSVVRQDDHPDDFLAWLLDRAGPGGQKDVRADTPPTDDQKIAKLADAVGRCVSDGCLRGTSIWSITAHIATHTGGKLSAGLEEALTIAKRRHSFAPIYGAALLDRKAPRDWGGWSVVADGDFQKPALTLGQLYLVELSECTNTAAVLDRICQVAQKAWADDAIIAGLVRALNSVLKPQANLCPFGSAGFPPWGHLRRVIAAAQFAGEPPTVPAVREGRSLVVNCVWCPLSHKHSICLGTCDGGIDDECTCPVGVGDGHRAVVCPDDPEFGRSPLALVGYVIKEVAPE